MRYFEIRAVHRISLNSANWMSLNDVASKWQTNRLDKITEQNNFLGSWNKYFYLYESFSKIVIITNIWWSTSNQGAVNKQRDLHNIWLDLNLFLELETYIKLYLSILLLLFQLKKRIHNNRLYLYIDFIQKWKVKEVPYIFNKT